MVMKEVLTDLEDMNLLSRLFPHFANDQQNQQNQQNSLESNPESTIPINEDEEGVGNSPAENQEDEQSSPSSWQEPEIDSSILDKVLSFHGYSLIIHCNFHLFLSTTTPLYSHFHSLDHSHYQTRDCWSLSRGRSSLSHVSLSPAYLSKHVLLL